MNVDVDLEETDADRAYEARPDCCEDCDEMLAVAGDLSVYERELTERGRRIRAVLDALRAAFRTAARAFAELVRQLRSAWRRVTTYGRPAAGARRARLRALHVDYRRRLRNRRRRPR
jgi:hypothetical protein